MAYLDYFGNVLPATPWSSHVVTGSAKIPTLTGTSGDDNFIPNGSTTLIGGAGNDTYQYVTSATKIVEAANGGIDTVYVNSSYVMPDNVENLIVWYAPSVKGNALANVMIGSAADETINGGAGNDALAGGGGHDVFRFDANSGLDMIGDFTTSGTNSDMVRLAGYTQFTSFDQVRAAMRQSGSNVILQLDANDAILFRNQTLANFSASNFELAIDTSHMSLSFDEEFNSLSLWNSAAKTGTWRTDYGYGATSDSLLSRTLPGNKEQEIYVDPTMKGSGTKAVGINPFSINNGVLTITAAPTPAALKQQLYNMNYTSGLLTTKNSFAQQYGYFEARIQVPSASGMWPAFWLLPADGSWPPEADIMENYGGASTFFTSHSGASNTQSSSSDYDPDIAKGFHTYGFMWTKDTLTWYMDGVQIYQTATPADFNKPMYILLDLAVTSGAAAGMTGQMNVDYVRAYTLGSQPTATVVPQVQHLTGTSGNDMYTVASSATTIAEAVKGGYDTVTSSVDYTLPDNVEALTLTGAARTAIGNALANTLTGTSGNDIINGLGGADTMIGGAGDDKYRVDNPNDVIVEKAGEGHDLVFATNNYVLPANVEDLTMGGEAGFSLTGNALANALVGNGGANLIDGKGGMDTLTGGAGADTFRFDTALDGSFASITDFTVGSDLIALDQKIFGMASTGNLKPKEFVTGTAAATANTRIIYDSGTGDLFYDPDGTGSAAQVKFAHVTPGLALSNKSFTITA